MLYCFLFDGLFTVLDGMGAFAAPFFGGLLYEILSFFYGLVGCAV